MSVYLHDIPLAEAITCLKVALQGENLDKVLRVETIALDENAVGRVLASPVWAKISSPHYHASAMDGFAVRSGDTVGAQPSHPIVLRLKQAEPGADGLQARYLDTGDELPQEFDAVIPIENVESLDELGQVSTEIRNPVFIRVRASVTPWSHIRLMGEDIVETQLVLPAGRVLGAADLGAAAACGHSEFSVAGKPRVAIVPTGTELVQPGEVVKPGEIIEFNSLVLAGLVNSWGGIAERMPIVADDFESIAERVQEYSGEYDLILLNAGSSAGAEDYSAGVIEKLGKVLVHGVAIRPGHPVILGLIDRKQDSAAGKNGRCVPIIGVPGYPVSAALVAELFVEPLIAMWTGRATIEIPVEKAKFTRKAASPGGDDDFVRVVAGFVGDELLVTPLARGAGVISSLVKADGIVILPRGSQGIEAGAWVDVRLHRSRAELKRTILCIGSHDMSLDILAQILMRLDRRLVSVHVGSVGGLVALDRGEAHLAGAHLLDADSGEYNLPFIRRYISDQKICVYGFVEREQGLMVKPGNSKNIRNLGDLQSDVNGSGISKAIRFVNRQRGSGTRILLDHEIQKAGIATSAIQGYNQEEYTHLGVAVAISSGRADCGLGIPAAAKVLGLDFIPLFKESYQLVVPKTIAASDLMKPLFAVLDDPKFQEEILAMPGYNLSNMGQLIAEV